MDPMTHAVVQFPRFDPKRTEQFLLSLPGVLDASVWVRDEALKAHVTGDAFAELNDKELQTACLDALGLHQVPRQIVMLRAHPLAA